MGDTIHSFAPIIGPAARVLILGTLPGVESLRMRQYYAHPRNAFWRIMGDLFAAGPGLEYDARLAKLREAGVAVWDVLESAERPGSSDSRIALDTARANDFATFLQANPTIHSIHFNGATAERLFTLRVLRHHPELASLERHLLPSTSPQHARLTLSAKLAAWSSLADSLHCGREGVTGC